MKGKYWLSILLVVVLVLALNPEKIGLAQEDTTGAVSIEETRGFDPPLISYQGRLLESGTPVTGNRTMTFKFFYYESGGTALWTETKSVMVTNGMFQTNLGDTTPFSFATIIKMDQNLWIEITVGSTTMPRQLMTGSPYAFSLVPGAHIHGETEFLLQAVNEDIGTGLFGASRFGTGVFGESFGVGSTGHGVHGVSDAGTGVAGSSTSGTGVVGWSDSGFGVHGVSNTATAIEGWSTTGDGVFGMSTDGKGVVGYSENGPGVWAGSDSGGADPWPALLAHSFAEDGVGVVSMTDSTNTNMVLEQMGDGPFMKAYAYGDDYHKFVIENDGSFKQALDANGLIKAAALFYCSGSGSSIERHFNNHMHGTPGAFIDDGLTSGSCYIDFGFDISNRFWIAQNPDPTPTIVSCSLLSDNQTLWCQRYDLSGTSITYPDGNIMLIIY